jgi:hypothetical protein
VRHALDAVRTLRPRIERSTKDTSDALDVLKTVAKGPSAVDKILAGGKGGR